MTGTRGIDRRNFLIRSAVGGAAAVMTGRLVSAEERTAMALATMPPLAKPAAKTGTPPPLAADLDVVKKGHAIECRINAENPYSFVPSPGRITQYHVAGGPGIRYDSHVYANYYVPPYYDSLIAKLVVHGATRSEAIERSEQALARFKVEGVSTTIPFHRAILADSDYRANNVNTRWVEEAFIARV